MSRKQLKRTAGDMAKTAIVGFFILIAACGVGFGVASADSADDLASLGSFGFDEATHGKTATNASNTTSVDAALVQPSGAGDFVLTETASRDLESGMALVDSLEAAKEERIAQENMLAVKRVQEHKTMQGIDPATDEAGAPVSESSQEYGLPAVDWSCGEQAFLAEWTVRIDKYLAGSAMEGLGAPFALAAWKYGVDPRWSPAIANTESSKGAYCIQPHNAWGWGAADENPAGLAAVWDSWEAAINDHVAGLAKGYGYSLTTTAARTYCPPAAAAWYEKTLGQMRLI